MDKTINTIKEKSKLVFFIETKAVKSVTPKTKNEHQAQAMPFAYYAQS